MRLFILLPLLIAPFICMAYIHMEEKLPEDLHKELAQRGLMQEIQEQLRSYPAYPLYHYRVQEILHITGAQDASLYGLQSGVYIRLMDQSLWQAAILEEPLALSLPLNSIVSVKPNDRWNQDPDFPNLFLQAHNKETLQMRLILQGNPQANRLATHVLKEILEVEQKIALENGTFWQVEKEDLARILLDWEPSDSIVIGLNTDFFSKKMPNILMNLSKGTYCIAGWCP